MDQSSDKKLKAFQAAADIFVLPFSCESFGIAALGRIAAGTPLVLADRVAARSACSLSSAYPRENISF